MNKGSHFFKNLDALRFMAFLGVFILHTLPVAEATIHSATAGDYIHSIFSFYYLGVPFFFSLSSFLITYKLLEEYKQNGKIRLFTFYLKRGLRIWPIYFLLLLVCFVALPLISLLLNVEQPSLPDIFPFLFFYANFYMIDHGVGFFAPLLVLWSVSIEEQFYILWGLVLKFLKKYLVPFIFFLLAGSLIFSYYYLYLNHQSLRNLKLHSLYAVPDFCIGTLIAIICHRKKGGFNFLAGLPTFTYASVYILLVGMYVIKTFRVTNLDPILTNLIFAVCYGLILFDQSFNNRRIFNAGRFFFLNYLGKISYGLYIYHELAISLMEKLFNFFKPVQPFGKTLLQAISTLALTILIAHLSYRYFEKMFLRMKEKL